MSSFNTVLVVGATSGIGEQLVRRYHAQGKEVIAAGRRVERLTTMQKELPGLEMRQVWTNGHLRPRNMLTRPAQIDVQDLPAFQTAVQAIIQEFPKLDTVMMISGIQKSFDFKDVSAASIDSIGMEVTTNVTAPMVLANVVVPHFASVDFPTYFVLCSSGLAFVPHPMFPVYCPTKAAIHSFALALRQQLDGTSVSVIELAPPYVATELDTQHREMVRQKTQPMPIDEYMDSAIAGLDRRIDGKPPKEVTVGFSEMVATAWRKAFDPILAQIGTSAM